MPLSIGDKLGPYQILALIGAGGMGEVYRAKDTKLKRDVAIKVLPAAVANDSGRLARFQREAEVLASLNHPNIAAIYGVEERALAMELVEGESPKGPLPFEDAWKIALQIADALAYAHERGIVHRDLKPTNVMVTPEGVVKLLDFGLAKAFNDFGESSTNDPVNSPTVTLGATVAGTILGTAAYMAPEQAKGKRVDKRADIWAWGVVLYELLTGERMHQGEDVADTLAQVLTREPDLMRVPSKVRGVLRECLLKDPKQRLRDIGDAKRLLDVGQVSGMPVQGWTLHHWLAWAVSGVLAVALATIAFVHFRSTPSTDQQMMHLSMSLPENASVRSLALSPDGHDLVIAAVIGSKYNLWIRRMDSTELRALPGTDLARVPFWSPDGRWIGFFADGKLKTIPATGGPATVLCDAADPSGGTWNSDGVILFVSAPSPIYRVAQTGGACTPLSKAETGGAPQFPEFMPDGRHFFYVQTGIASAPGVYVASLDDPKGRRVLADESSVAYVPPQAGSKLSSLLFLRENTLMVQPFDAVTLQPVGEVVSVAEQVSLSNSRPQMAVSLSRNGVLTYLSNGETEARSQIVQVDRQGKEVEKIAGVGNLTMLSLSPDEKTAAYTRRETASAMNTLWLRDLIRGSESRFTMLAEGSFSGVWSPQVDRIAFGGMRPGGTAIDLYVKDIGGRGEEPLLRNGNPKSPSDWSRDGSYLVYTEVDPKNRGDIWYLQEPLSKERKAIPFQATPFNESQGQVSPDGRMLAYTSNESGQDEVYVRPFPTGDGKWTVSTKGGNEPRWRRDGKELFYLEGQIPRYRMMSVAVMPGTRQPFGVPQRLFDLRANTLIPEDNGFAYSPSADGRRFLVSAFATDLRPTLDVLLNWQKATAGKGR